jgi:hypothetical protein
VVTLRVAVCASSADIDRARSVAERLTAAGCEVTSDWWRHHPVTRGTTDAECTREERLTAALWCEEAVGGADVVVVLGSDHVSEGRAYELALARSRPVDVVIVGRLPTAFGEPRDGHPLDAGERWHDTDEQAIAYLAQRVAGVWR